LLGLCRSGAGVFCSIILFAGPSLVKQQQRGMGGLYLSWNCLRVRRATAQSGSPKPAGGFMSSARDQIEIFLNRSRKT
jgi:hypothetical protein